MWVRVRVEVGGGRERGGRGDKVIRSGGRSHSTEAANKCIGPEPRQRTTLVQVVE